MYSNLLVPLDGSKTAEAVLPRARYLATALKIPVDLLAVVDLAEMAAHLPAANARMFDSIVETEVAHSGRYLRKVADSFAGVDVHCTVEKGSAQEVIAAKGAGSGMLTAMATHGHSGLGRMLLGSVTEKILRVTSNPLLVVRSDEAPTSANTPAFKSIILPLDGSELAESILPTVAELAKALNLELVLFRAYHLPYESYAGEDSFAAVNYDDVISAIRDEAKGYLEKVAAKAKGLGVAKVSCTAKEGLSTDEIVAAGKTTPGALIVMASHGRSGIKRMMLGSVSEAVVRHGNAPVLVLRPG
jgi:nucleotide-binding universal stress UspA family protein